MAEATPPPTIALREFAAFASAQLRAGRAAAIAEVGPGPSGRGTTLDPWIVLVDALRDEGLCFEAAVVALVFAVLEAGGRADGERLWEALLSLRPAHCTVLGFLAHKGAPTAVH